jgi:putative endopeptidase
MIMNLKSIPFMLLFALSLSCKQTERLEIQTIEAVSSAEPLSIDVHFMDSKVKAQEDFFLYCNGTWVKNNPVPPTESRWGSFNELEKNNMEKLTAILEDCSIAGDNQVYHKKMLGNYYQSFIDMDQRNKVGLTPIQEDLEKITAMNSKVEIIGIIAEHHHMGVRSLFSFSVGQDIKQVDRNISYIGQGGISLPNKEYYLNENKQDILKQFQAYVQKMFSMVGHSPEESERMASSVVRFETELAKAMMSPAEQRIPEKTYNKRSREEVIEAMGKLDFDLYLSAVGSSSFDSMVVSQPDFVKRISELLSEVEMDEWKNYLSWKVVNHFASHLNQEMVDAHFAFYGTVLSGKSEMKPIRERAIEAITGKDFGEMLGKEFVDRHFSALAQTKVNEMVDNLLLVFRDRIEQLEWMSTETKKEALGKLNSIGRKLGFPSKWEDYSSLQFNAETYVQNLKEDAAFTHKKNMRKLDEPIDKQRWSMPAHMVNAYYHPLLNEIAFPAGIMQPPFFDERAEDAVNYGRIGMVIGHEFTHGFDDMGSKFAADGTFRNWWTENDRLAFESKTKILGDTYSAFCPIEGHCVNPNLTMGENIADLGGLTMAYHAYARTNEYQQGKLRNGFTPAQRFFIAYAQLWKINYTQQEMKNRIANDPHSPGMYRVNGPLKNCPEFFETFSVKEGSIMRNPPEKISKIW